MMGQLGPTVMSQAKLLYSRIGLVSFHPAETFTCLRFQEAFAPDTAAGPQILFYLRNERNVVKKVQISGSLQMQGVA